MSDTKEVYRTAEVMLSESGANLLETSLFSDVTVNCGDRTWKLHKAITCSRCPYFNKAFNGHFKEAATGDLTIKEQIPEYVDQAIRYLYTGKAPEDTLESWPIDLFKVADFLQIKSLERQSIETIKTRLREVMGFLADIHNKPKEAQMEKAFPDFIYLARTAYGADSASYYRLRDISKRFFAQIKQHIINDD
ncbi:BTB/POZ protein [Hypoxylon trugodes]|uniref:BTB/POZ protein n=1 Tax=Hypoxylon trugodes TaxID=326681 RepID=UPI00218D45BA|nr:BTB/POZ protein [Hypoxylon trugodes]KAI1390354.1 BTB/POZ protein [Hypoxylon trugodes]